MIFYQAVICGSILIDFYIAFKNFEKDPFNNEDKKSTKIKFVKNLKSGSFKGLLVIFFVNSKIFFSTLGK